MSRIQSIWNLLVKSKLWIIGVGIGAAVGLAVASTMTFLDWRINPGGIFHDAYNTDWAIVWETATSWFLPVAAIVAVFTWLLLYALSRRH